MEEKKIETEEMRMPLIGDPAPEFRSMTTKGKVNFPGDYSGKWIVLFSHPADFTPVCTSEFLELARAKDEFDRLNVQLIGLSIDSLHSHLAWARNIESIEWKGEKGTVLPFPIIADASMEVAKKYGMLHSVARTQTVRSLFVIDPEGVIRAILYYPMNTGRNIPEIIRIVKSLQLLDNEGYDTPANWEPGDDVVLGAPLTLEDADERVKGDDSLNPLEWYLTVKKM